MNDEVLEQASLTQGHLRSRRASWPRMLGEPARRVHADRYDRVKTALNSIAEPPAKPVGLTWKNVAQGLKMYRNVRKCQGPYAKMKNEPKLTFITLAAGWTLT